MRAPAILILLSLIVPAGLQAETIVLKNGRKILVDSVHEDKDRYWYEIGDDSYAIPKSSVDHVDSLGSAAGDRRDAERGATVTPQSTTLMFATSVPVNVVKNDHIDDAAIAEAERNREPSVAAGANFQAGRFSLEQGDRDAAARYFDRALRFQPDDAVVLTNYASVLVRIGRPRDAIPLAEHATRVAPELADAWAVLGYALEQGDRAKDAVPAFEKSLKLRPDANIQQFLARARRESSTEADFTSSESSHFTLRFEGHTEQNRLPQAILQELESDYDQLVAQLGIAPRGNIAVILYTERDFFDITQAPSWSGALYDGKLRIPTNGLTSMNGQLARVLHHELTHAFITQIARGRCPLWLNEGIAQLMEPRHTTSSGPLLANLFRTQREIPLNSMEGTLLGMDTNTAAVAYAESLLAVEYINDTYGMSDVRRLLERIGEGSATEAALRSTFNVGYGQFQEDLSTYANSKFGQ